MTPYAFNWLVEPKTRQCNFFSLTAGGTGAKYWTLDTTADVGSESTSVSVIFR
jgi:hypothetical protein